MKNEILSADKALPESYSVESVNKAVSGALKGKRKLAYIRGTWELSDGRFWRAEEIRGDLLTDLNISFGLINSSGVVELYNKGYLKTEIQKLRKKYPNLRVNISIGGWQAEGFSDAASSAENRRIFTESVISLIEEMDFTGVDIDWEYPVGPDWGQSIKCSPSDKENFILLLSDLRGALTKLGEEKKFYYSLSAAIPSSSWFTKKNDVYTASLICDYLNLMTYDYYGSWSQITGHNASLYHNPKDPDPWCSDYGVKSCLDAGVASEKIVFGIPFYSFGWKDVDEGENYGLHEKTGSYFGPVSFSDLNKFTDGFEEYWDDYGKYYYRYNRNSRIFIDCVSTRMIKEMAAYAKEKNLGGLMYWEYAHDMEAQLLSCLSASIE